MSRKEPVDSKRGFADVIGFALLVAGLLLLVAQISFDRFDLPFNQTPPNDLTHNKIGTLGAYLAYSFFFVFGVAAYVLPILLGLFGLALLFGFPAHVREHRGWNALWAVVLLFSLSGLLHLMDSADAGRHLADSATLMGR